MSDHDTRPFGSHPSAQRPQHPTQLIAARPGLPPRRPGGGDGGGGDGGGHVVTIDLIDGDLIKGSGAEIFLLIGGNRRWVPDPATLVTLRPPRGVITITDAQLTGIPRGADLPSRADGHLYQAPPLPAVFYTESGQRHWVPDQSTLDAYGGQVAVTFVSHADLVAIPEGDPLPSLKQPTTVGEYLRSQAEMHVDPPQETHTRTVDSTTTIDGIDVVLINEHAALRSISENTWALSPAADVLYPGALVQGATLPTGLLAPVAGGLRRAGGTITIKTDLKNAQPLSKSATLDDVTDHGVEDARVALLRQLDPQDSAAYIDLSSHQARSFEHAMMKIGVAFHAGAVDASANASFTDNVKKNSIVVAFRQVFYSMVFEPPVGDNQFFAADVTVAQVQAVSDQVRNPVCYISQVDYGRSIVICASSSESETKLSGALQVAINESAKTTPGGKINVDAESERVLANSSLRVVVVGGDSRAGTDEVRDPINHLSDWINTGGTFTADNPGQPLRYVVRHAGSQRIVQINLSSEYDEVVGVAAKPADRTFQIWDGRGGGTVNTGIKVHKGDQLDINATGTNWSGVILTGDYGPEGWTTWDTPGGGGAGYPMPDRHPFGLVGNWDSGDVKAQGWFWIGTGYSGTDQPRQDGTHTLFLGTNDNNPLNGDSDKRFTVRVRVNPDINRLGLNGVGRASTT